MAPGFFLPEIYLCWCNRSRFGVTLRLAAWCGGERRMRAVTVGQVVAWCGREGTVEHVARSIATGEQVVTVRFGFRELLRVKGSDCEPVGAAGYVAELGVPGRIVRVINGGLYAIFRSDDGAVFTVMAEHLTRDRGDGLVRYRGPARRGVAFTTKSAAASVLKGEARHG
jgi:hypothetical protein